ncbi:NAD(P)-dependent oxidoreductase [Ameyamaea chiangmaiensis]|nr:NAD(P)-dependent oxidoreductase [Ameyamaea chiangmaiensis]
MEQLVAERLLAAGHRLVVYDCVSARTENLVARGATFVETPASVAWEVDVVFSMMADDVTLEDMIFGEDGIATGLSPRAIHVNCGTISCSQARRLREGHAQRGQTYVGAIIFGGPAEAEAGKLSILATGVNDVWLRLLPVLKCLGGCVFNGGRSFPSSRSGIGAGTMYVGPAESQCLA